MVCGVKYPRYYGNLRAIACNNYFRAYHFQPIGRTSKFGCLVESQDYLLPPMYVTLGFLEIWRGFW